jgi:hypothetical protein
MVSARGCSCREPACQQRLARLNALCSITDCCHQSNTDQAAGSCLSLPLPAQWDNGNSCGRCLTAWCVDERCATRNKRVQVMVTDLCPECAEGEATCSFCRTLLLMTNVPGSSTLPSGCTDVACSSPACPCTAPECSTAGDVDFSIPVYRDITGMWPHRLKIQWEWSDCSANIDGDILLTPKVGGRLG